MREGIHPDYVDTTFVCSCGEKFVTHSTAGGELHLELCSKCHPFYTGTQKLVDTGGRVQRFSDKFGNAAAAVMEREAADRDARRKAAEEAAVAAKSEREARESAKAAKAATFETKAHKAEAAAARAAEAAAAAPTEEPVGDAPTADEPVEAAPAADEPVEVLEEVEAGEVETESGAEEAAE